MADRIRLDGKVAVVTGAAGVIGSATMRLLAERGARIVAVDRKKAELKAAIKELQSKGYDVPNYPDSDATPADKEIRARYAKVLGSAVTKMIRRGYL